MALASETREVKGDVYTVTQFKATKALRVLTELGRLVGPSVGLLVDDSEGVSFEDPDLISKAVAALAERADADTVEKLVRTLSESTQVQVGGQGALLQLPAIFDTHFAGSDLPNLFAWLKFALEVHFGGFFDSLGVSAPGGSTAPVAGVAG